MSPHLHQQQQHTRCRAGSQLCVRYTTFFMYYIKQVSYWQLCAEMSLTVKWDNTVYLSSCASNNNHSHSLFLIWAFLSTCSLFTLWLSCSLPVHTLVFLLPISSFLLPLSYQYLHLCFLAEFLSTFSRVLHQFLLFSVHPAPPFYFPITPLSYRSIW